MSSSWAIQGLFWSMMTSTNPPFSGGLEELGPLGMMRRESDELRLARFADRVGGLLELLAHGPLHFGVEVSVAQGVEEDQVDVVGLKRVQPLVQLLDELRVYPVGPW